MRFLGRLSDPIRFDTEWTTSFETFASFFAWKRILLSSISKPFLSGIASFRNLENSRPRMSTYVVHAHLKVERLRYSSSASMPLPVRETSPCKITAKISLRGTFTRHLSRDNEPFLVISWRETRGRETGKERGKGGDERITRSLAKWENLSEILKIGSENSSSYLCYLKSVQISRIIRSVIMINNDCFVRKILWMDRYF